jgi:uncharacterized protein DUF6869
VTPLTELVDAYLRYAREKREEGFWAWDELTKLVLHEPETAWEVVTMLVERANDPAELAYVAAGPLEDLIHRHGARLVDRMEVQSRRSAQFRRALGAVWGWSSLPSELRARFARLPGVQIPGLQTTATVPRKRTRRRR